MQLRIRQKMFSWTESYDVHDESGYAKYEVRGALLSLGHGAYAHKAQCRNHQNPFHAI